MLDSHCHLDRFQNPETVAAQAAGRGVFIVAMTNLPSHFEAGLQHVRQLTGVRLSLGLHPLAAADHAREIGAFERCLPRTTFVGEVGLDFSRQGMATAERQVESFRQVIRLVAGKAKFISLHSRRAETAVLEVLKEQGVVGAVFHWYTGSLRTLDDILQGGHFLSVNPAMTSAERGRAVIRRIPRDRLLTETDGPHVLVDEAPALPWHVGLVEEFVAREWESSRADVRRQVWTNFTKILGVNLSGGVSAGE
jgi:TatD DNase family protein